LADENARRLLHVVDNILAISQLEGGHLKLQPTSTNLSSLIEGVVEENQHTARTRGVTIESSITLKGETASLDQEKTIQVLNILLDNAIEFSKQGDSIAVSVEEESNSTYVFSVCDRGVGIPVDEFSNIFDKFRQIDGSHTRSHQGLGLGLAIAKGLVELHGGLLMVESTVDKGSTFRFTVQAGPG
jgi:signal transduction histidine kinase